MPDRSQNTFRQLLTVYHVRCAAAAILIGRAVIMIVDGDKAHTHEWKDSFQITTRFNVVSAETR